MVRRLEFQLKYAPAVWSHLRVIERKHHSLIRREIERRLRWDADVEAANRKPLRPPAALGTAWECRFGPRNRFRVFYDIDQQGRIVKILAIGEKRRNPLWVGGEEFEL